VTGVCQCGLGYTGPKCEIECPPGTWGVACGNVVNAIGQQLNHVIAKMDSACASQDTLEMIAPKIVKMGNGVKAVSRNVIVEVITVTRLLVNVNVRQVIKELIAK